MIIIIIQYAVVIIYHNKEYYDVSLCKTNKNNFYNIKILVDINYNKILESLKNNMELPNKKELIRLIKRNIKPIDILEKLYNENSLIYINILNQIK